jgi:uncharacterized protein YfaS (alpha-2-macroglobulin family)
MACVRCLIILPALLLAVLAHAQSGQRVHVHGTVSDATTGKPLIAAVVEWVDESGTLQAVTQTNSEGGYGLFVNVGARVILRVKENGYVLSVDTLPPLDAADSDTRFDLRLFPSSE